ncbi:MAG TPA: tripartite tricarboxylate transporter substrate-binding protein [candidate division Zixibacteria bacterium]|nr:tripartite tricarboxylate transporter substrate-binding protein [candidate division Zixibacteria bacterium]
MAATENGDFYRNKVVRIVVGSSPGGGYDYWARLLARFLPKYLPGNPDVVVQNMPGGGSVAAANYLYEVAKPDGLTVGMPNQLVYLGQIGGSREVKFDIQKFNWIGSPDRNPTVLYIRADSPYKTMDDVINAKLPPKCGGSGRDSSSIIFALRTLIGAKFEVVLGYQGGSQTDLAVQRGEIVCRSMGLGAHFSREPFTEWHRKGFDRHLLQTGMQRDRRAPDVPTLYELMDRYNTHDLGRRIARILTAGEIFGHPMIAPPGTPPERVKTIRDAYAKALRDPELVAEIRKKNYDFDPVSGDELQELAKTVASQPPEVIEQVKRLLGR